MDGQILMRQREPRSQVLEVMNEKRRQEKISPLEMPAHLEIAEKKYKLGTCNPGKIALQKV